MASKNAIRMTPYIIVIAFVVIAIIAGNYNLKQEDIWRQDLKVMSNPYSPWWLENHRQGIVDNKYRATANRLGDAVASNSTLINEYYTTHFVNPYNNTVFVRLKDADESVKAQFLELMRPPEGVAVVFLRGSATHSELEGWRSIVHSLYPTFEKQGVVLGSSGGAGTNGTICFGVKDLTDDRIQIFREVVKGRVPLGIIVLYEEFEEVLL